MSKKISAFIHTLTRCGLIVLLLPILGWGQEEELLVSPKPTHFEAKVPLSNLVVVKEILPNYEKDLFMARPYSIAVNSRQWVYVYDMKLMKIFIFNNQWEYTGQFLEQGTLPGQVNPEGGLMKEMYIGPDDTIYIHDATDQILHFAADGKFIGQKKINRLDPFPKAFRPVVDKKGYLYSYAVNNNIIDQFDDKLNLVQSFIDRNLNDCYVIQKPAFEDFFSQNPMNQYYQEKGWLRADSRNTSLDITANGLLLVYLHRPSSAYLFKGKQLIHHFDVLIDSVLIKFRERVEKALKEKSQMPTDKKQLFEMVMFDACFVDYDAPYFYLQFNHDKKENTLYQFNLKNKLTRIIKYGKSRVFFKFKRNGLFYGLASGDYHPIIMKTEEQ